MFFYRNGEKTVPNIANDKKSEINKGSSSANTWKMGFYAYIFNSNPESLFLLQNRKNLNVDSKKLEIATKKRIF